MRLGLCLAVASTTLVCLCLAQDGPGANAGGNQFQGAGEGAKATGARVRGRPVVYNKGTGKRRKTVTSVAGASEGGGRSVKVVNSGGKRTGAKGFMTEDARSQSVVSSDKKLSGDLSIQSEGGGESVYHKAQNRRGGRKRAQGKATHAKASKDSSYQSKRVSADVDAAESTDARQTGEIELKLADGRAHPKSPFKYTVTCPPGARPGSSQCTEVWEDKDGNKWTCEAAPSSGGLTKCRKNSGRGVGATSDRDGNSAVNYRGITFSKADCTKQGTKYVCKVSKGLLSASADRIRPTNGASCYVDAKGGRSVEITDVAYQRAPGTGGDYQYNARDCFTMTGTLNFKGYRPAELKGIVNRIGIQFHAMVTPMGKFECADRAVCPKTGLAPECYYCNLCQGGWGKKGLAMGFDEAKLQEACDQDAARRQRFSVTFCPPKEVNEEICATFDKSIKSEYHRKKGSLDTRVEVYLLPKPPPTEEAMAAGFDGLNFIQRSLNNAKAAAYAIQSGKAATDEDKRYVYKAEQLKADMVGCSTFAMDFGMGNGGKSTGIDGLVTASQLAQNFQRTLLGRKAQCDALKSS